MTFTNLATNEAYRAILEYCQYDINDYVLILNIQQLTFENFLSLDYDNNSLFFKTIELSKNHSGERCSHVMRLLVEQAKQISANMRLVVFLLSCSSRCNEQPLQKILDLNSPDNMNHNTVHVAITFFNILNQWAQSTDYNITSDINYFKITRPMLTQVFLCKNKAIQDQFLMFYHLSISRNSLPLVQLQKLYLEGSMMGFRLFDVLIMNTSQENLALFYQELRFLHQNGWITKKDHVDILTSHALEKNGFSPIHEILSTNCPDKIMAYVQEVVSILPPSQLKAMLTKENKNHYTAIQQGLNNGSRTASLVVSALFLSLIDPNLGVFTLDECKKMLSASHKKRLCCANKTNSYEVNQAINATRRRINILIDQQNKNASEFSYSSVRSTLMYFNSDPKSKVVEPALEYAISPSPTFENP